LTGCANIPAADSRRYAIAHETGRRAVEMVREGLRPSQVLTRKAFENAIRVLMAIGGSTNAIIHLVALAGRLEIDLPLEDFDRISRTTPMLVNLKPSGKYLMEDLFYAGGIPALMKELGDLLHLDALTVTGKTMGENLVKAEVSNPEVISPRSNPLMAEGGTVVLRGNLCPNGAVLKQTAASPELLNHRGPALVFKDREDLLSRIDDPNLPVDKDSVLILQHAGPKGAPGMPE